MNADPFIRIECLGGNCPVQAEGVVDDATFYFRARGNRWSMSIGGSDVVMNPDWYHEEPYGDEEYAAGYMPAYQALGFIAQAIGLYAKQGEAA